MRKFLTVLALTVFGLVTPSIADDAARAQLAGRTLNVIVTFDNAGSGARLWSVLYAALVARLPQTQIRYTFNGAGEGISGVNELYAAAPGALTMAFSTMPELAFAQTHNTEGVAYDLNKAQYLVGIQRQGQIMSVRKGLTTDIETLRQPGERLLYPVDSISTNGAVMALMLNAATGIPSQLVVGFDSADAQRALIVGEVDMKRQMLSPDVNAVIESGDIVSIYTLFGSGFPPQVDASKTLASVTLPGTPAAVTDYVVAMLQLGRAFYAAPGADPKDADALRVVLKEVLSDDAVLAEVAKQFAIVSMIPYEEVETMMQAMLLADPKARAAVEYAHTCGLQMSRGTLARCDFSAMPQ